MIVPIASPLKHLHQGLIPDKVIPPLPLTDNQEMPSVTMLFDFFLVAIGFGLIIFVHELGHFLAARWAGIRVLAFAIGFGPALVSFRKGIGFRRGSSHREFLVLARERGDARGLVPGVSPTEYRFNALPLGGYVRMLGQDDADPSARSDEKDSYQSCPPIKRMVVISAGVIMNIITAAILFIIVFAAGLKTESARIGRVAPAMPAALAAAENDGPKIVGLRPGDLVVAVNGSRVEKFTDLQSAVAMSRKGRPVRVEIERPGRTDRLVFPIIPVEDRTSGFLALGIEPARGPNVITPRTPAERTQLEQLFAREGFAGLAPGATLAAVNGVNINEVGGEWSLAAAAGASGGKDMTIAFTNPDGARVEFKRTPNAALQSTHLERDINGDTVLTPIDHLAGLALVTRVERCEPAGESAGLKPGDVFARVGETQWPSPDALRRELQRLTRPTITATVLRRVDNKDQLVDLGEVPVTDGRIGFLIEQRSDVPAFVTTITRGNLVSRTSNTAPAVSTSELAAVKAAALPGSRITHVNGTATPTMRDVRDAFRAAALTAGANTPELTLTLQLPDDAASTETRTLRLSKQETEEVASLAWTSPVPPDLFEVEQTLIVRRSPIAAIGKGLSETRNMVLNVYMTFARLIQGTVKIEHLKGPVGIAHVGTLIAGKGWVWLLFFMAMISVNLAVINFLPLPIVDGGHFVFLLWEQFTGRPVSVAVQNAAAIVGLLLIAAVFLITTYNDLANLLWR